ncbi:MAG: hypothetical protein LBU34_00310 [Planctomycetaceae bacterium]|jgi:hypothetical protein|nr:hypothetical protein [Planctomycetaceae bacterium]
MNMKTLKKTLILYFFISLFISSVCFANDSTEWEKDYQAIQNQIARKLPEHIAPQSYRQDALILPKDRDPLDVLLRRVQALANHLAASGVDVATEIQSLQKIKTAAVSVTPTEIDRRRELFRQTKLLQRTIAFKNPLLNFDSILFVKRHFCSGNNELQGNHMIDQYFGFNALPGGGIFVLEKAFSEQPVVRNILENKHIEGGRYHQRIFDSNWGFLSPELSFDGREILFAAVDTALQPRHSFQWNTDNTYHIFKTTFDGTAVTQLTDGIWNDFDPCFLPSGRIAFISERRGGYGRCHPRPAPSYTLHSVNNDGSDIVTLSPHETNEWQPSINHAGMIVYTRWDYVDRGAHQAHHAWETTPDGRDARAVQGNYPQQEINRPHMEMDIRAIPGSHCYVATAASHHGQSFGSLVLIDPQLPDNGAMSAVKRLTPEELFPESEQPIYKAESTAVYGQPFPLSEDFYLCVYDAFGSQTGGTKNNYGIYLIDTFGNRVPVYRDPAISCQSPIPVQSISKPPVIPHLTSVGVPLKPGTTFKPLPKPQELLSETAQVSVINVYNSRYPFPANRKIKELRIVQIIPKTTPLSDQPQIGYGMQKNARMVLGTVPVEEDGSASFTMPVNVPVYFQALDENGYAIQSMRSATYVKPGEHLVCNGCHEDRLKSSINSGQIPLATQRLPSEIRPEPTGSKPFRFPILVQPVLNKHCTECHEKESQNGKTFSLAKGIAKRHFYESYDNLKPYIFFYDDYRWTEPETIPGKFGALASPLLHLLEQGHYNTVLSLEERRRLSLWMDMNGDFYGSFEEIERQQNGEVVMPKLF